MLTRRNFLLLVVLALGLDFGFSRFFGRAPAPPGWRIERWQAGFGSWARGGFGVAYDIAIPNNYDFAQKCGSAWIGGDEDSSADFRIKLSFAPSAREQEAEFALFLKSDAASMASELGRTAADIQVGAPLPFATGALRFTRQDVTLPDARFESDNGATSTGAARGFFLAGENLAVVADLAGPRPAEISEQIVGALRRARGVGLIDLLSGAVHGLFGC